MRNFRLSFTITILTAFTLLFLAAAGGSLVARWQVARDAAMGTAVDVIVEIGDKVAARVEGMIRPLSLAARVIAAGPDLDDPAPLLAVLRSLPQATVVHVGRHDGAWLAVGVAEDLPPEIRAALPMPEATRYVMRRMPPGGLPGLAQGFDELGNPAGASVTIRAALDPRQETWFLVGQNGNEVSVSDLYRLGVLRRPGIAVAARLPGNIGVAAVEISLEELAGLLSRQGVSPESHLFIADENGILLAHNRPHLAVRADGQGWTTLASSSDPLLRDIWRAYQEGRLEEGPLVLLALDDRNFAARVTPIDVAAGRALFAVVLTPVADLIEPVIRAEQRGLVISLGLMVLALVGIWLLASRIARPLSWLSNEADAIRRFELDSPIRIQSRITEVERLAGSMAAMKRTLGTFGRYVPKDLVRRLVASGADAELGGERRTITVMFCDVAGFTTIAERLDPDDVMRLTSAYFERLTEALLAEGATIDKFIGDAVMAVWNAPENDTAHAARACRAVLRARRVVDDATPDFAAHGWPPMHTRFGLNTGEAVVGHVGSRDRISWTSIGATVNLSARLEGLNKHYATTILATDATRAAAGEGFAWRWVDRVLPKGVLSPVDIFELLGEDAADASATTWQDFRDRYLAGDFTAARALLDTPALDGDALAAQYRARVQNFIADPPGPGWNGVMAFQEK